MPSSREVKLPSDETRSNNGERPKSPNILRRMCEQVDRNISSAPSSPRDTDSVFSSPRRAEKQIVMSERAEPEKPGLYGRGNWCGKLDEEASTSSGSNIERDHARIRDCLEKGRYAEATELCERVVAKCGLNDSTQCYKNQEILMK